MQHLVVYHNPDTMGYSADEIQDTGFLTRKNPNAFVGARAWVITGEGNPRHYRLVETFVVDGFSKKHDDDFPYEVFGSQRTRFPRDLVLNDEAWFKTFLKRMSNFSLGAQLIGPEDAVWFEARLRSERRATRTARPATPSTQAPRTTEPGQGSVEAVSTWLEWVNAFDATNEDDARKFVEASIVRRQGQPRFRKALLTAYDERCAISGCSVLEVLDAAHIMPYRGEHTNHLGNGLLLRTDLHTLFDVHLISVDPKMRRVCVAPDLLDSEYGAFHGRVLSEPKRAHDRPALEALRVHHAAWTAKQRASDRT